MRLFIRDELTASLTPSSPLPVKPVGNLPISRFSTKIGTTGSFYGVERVWDSLQPRGAPVGVGIMGELWDGGGLSFSIPAQDPNNKSGISYFPLPGFGVREVRILLGKQQPELPCEFWEADLLSPKSYP